MIYLPMTKLGAQETSPKFIQFGIFLPGVNPTAGYSVSVKIIHETDQYIQSVQPVVLPQTYSTDPVYGDYWSGSVDLATQPAPANAKAWGADGRYVYRYVVTSAKRGAIDFIIDPFSREVGIGRLSAITVGSTPYVFSGNELTWKTPALKNAIIYELMISEFRGDLGRTIRQLPYLADLGINCIEVMPISNVLATIDWGYDPIGYFCVAERFGTTQDFQKFVDHCHQNGIAVVIDSVYGHTGDDFAYTQLYGELQGDLANPFGGKRGDYGLLNDFSKKLTQDYFYTVNQYWLDTFHIDGFRYDDVPEYWDGAIGFGYANLVYSTYQYVKSKSGSADHYQRFFDAGNINLIQIAEQLSDPVGVLNQSYSTGTWQNSTLSSAIDCAAGKAGAIQELGLQLGLNGYPTSVTANGETLPKTALQYVENHDHQRFICNFGTVPVDNAPFDVLLQQGNRDGKWPSVQPYLIALLTAKGTPLLAEGQELCENYWIPEQISEGRVMVYRPIRWNYFYDNDGRPIIRLVRKLTKIRRSGTQFSDGQHYFYNEYDNFNSKGLLAFSRDDGTTFSLIVVNFTNQEQTTGFAFPKSGTYTEQIEGVRDLVGVVANVTHPISVPSNYGCIWTGT
jgi:maltooligosyltrehalose trehalohydrolase